MSSPAIPNFDDFVKKTQPVSGSVKIPDFEDFTPKEAETKPQSPGFLKSFWNTAQGPRDMLQGLANFTAHPLQTLSGMGQQTIDLGSGAVDAFKQGKPLVGVRKAINTGINTVIPGLGASSEDAGESFDKGNYAEGFGKTAGVGVNAAVDALAPKAVPALARATAETITPGMRGPLGRLTKVDPRIAVNRSLRPTPSDPGFPQRIPQTLSSIKEANPGFEPKVEGGQFNLIPAAQKAIETHQAAMQPWMARAKGIRISGTPIVDATRAATGDMLPSESSSAGRLIGQASQDYGTDFTPEQLRDRLSLLNKRMNSFYSQAPGKQSAALSDIPEAVLKAQRDAVADSLYKALDPEGQGEGPRLIQSRTGDLIDMKDAALRRKNAIIAEQPLTPLGKVVDPFKALVRNFLPGKATGAGIAFAEGSEGRSLPFLRRAFDSIGDEPSNVLPKPGTPFYPSGSPQRAITAGDAITPPPTDTSFVRSRESAPHEQVMRPALGPGRAPFTQGIVVPDILGRPGQTTHHLIEGPTRPEIPTGQGVHEVPPADTMGINVSDAAKATARDPKTGRMFRYYTSESKK